MRKAGYHFTTHRVVREWFQDAGLRVEKIADILPERARLSNALTFGWLSSVLSQQLIAVAKPMQRVALAGDSCMTWKIHECRSEVRFRLTYGAKIVLKCGEVGVHGELGREGICRFFTFLWPRFWVLATSALCR